MSDLLFCPFCGGDAEVQIYGDNDMTYHVGMAYVECIDCDATGPRFHNKTYSEYLSEKCEQNAIDGWNHRSKQC